MSVLYIVLTMLVTGSFAGKVSTLYKNTHGEKLNDVIMYLARESSNSESIGIRFQSVDTDKNEPLSYDWMEKRAYVDGFSYYEKILVDEEFDEMETEGIIQAKIQGPLTAGSKVIASCSLPGSNISSSTLMFKFNLIAQVQMPHFPYSDVWNHISFRLGGIYIFNTKIDGGWQTEREFVTDASNYNGKITISIEVKPDRFQVTVFDGVTVNINQTAPGDTPSGITLVPVAWQPILHRLVYVKGN